MTDKRRVTIITLSVIAGTLLSFFIFKGKKGVLTKDDYITLGSIMAVSLALIIGISFILKRADKEFGDKL